jgi:hypothetical protein
VKYLLKLERRLPKLALDAAHGARAAFWDLTFMRYEMMHFGVRPGLDEADGLSGVYAMRSVARRCCADWLHAVFLLFVHSYSFTVLFIDIDSEEPGRLDPFAQAIVVLQGSTCKYID